MSFLFSKKADSHVLRQKIRLEKSETEGRGSQAGAKPATTCTAGGRTAGNTCGASAGWGGRAPAAGCTSCTCQAKGSVTTPDAERHGEGPGSDGGQVGLLLMGCGRRASCHLDCHVASGT